MHMISVVIPAWNEEKSLASCLEHIKKQTVEPDEIIVVNNNSTDRTVEIAKAHGVKVVDQPIQGLTPTRNKGFDTAKGDIIARTDADTQVSPDWLERIKANFDIDENVVGVSGPVMYFDLKRAESNTSASTFYAKVCKLIYGHNIMIGPNFAIRKSAWKKVKDKVYMNDKDVHEDIDISIHLSKVGKLVFDERLITKTSARRIKGKPSEFFIGYLIKQLKMIKMYRFKM